MSPQQSSNRVQPRGWVVNVHLYGGLVTFWYLLIYGITSLGFNHPWILPEHKGPAVVFEKPITPGVGADNVRKAEDVRNQLNLAGWVLPWTVKGERDGDLHFEISRPGKTYRIQTDSSTRTARVEARSTGLRSALHFMHGSTEGLPGASLLNTWGVYTEITTWLVLFFLGSGAFLWAKRAGDKRVVVAVLCGSVLLSTCLMALVYLG